VEFPQGAVGPWPPILAYATLGWLLALLTVLGPTRELAAQISQYGHPVQLALLAILAGLFALLYSRLMRGVVAGGSGLAVVAAVGLAAILLAPELISSYFQGPFIVDGRWLVILTTVALGTLGAVFGDAQARAAALPR
jgi:hypothetical protein